MRTSQWFTTVPVLMVGAPAGPTRALPHTGKRVMDNKTSATVFLLLVASVFTACAGATKPDALDTEIQRRVRTDVEQCSAAAGSQADLITVAPEGQYSFQVVGRANADNILTCMTNKRYSGKRVNVDSFGYDHTRRYGVEGEPSR